ncbi:MAG TPA: HAMP domain-containing sensor histidine kinase [Terriglobales bacterium]|jgi:signal transduction histidine kinase
MSIQLTLISNDHELFKLCQESLSELLGNNWSIQPATPGGNLPESDLYVWDCQSIADIPPHLTLRDTERHFFLLPRKMVASFRQRFPEAEMSVLLKPVTRAAFRAFFGQACAFYASRRGHQDEKIRVDRDEILQCLIQANLKLQEYDQDRTNFLARAVHDFRAPLTALTGYCGLLLGEQLGAITDDQREVLQRMQHSAKRLSRMAAAMFQLSIGKQLQASPNLRPNDLRECVDQALYELMPFTEEKNISVTVDFNAPPETLYFERSQIEQLLINLLDNACKFTPKFGFIEIRAYPFFWQRRCGTTARRLEDRRREDSETANTFRVDIRDSGPGIPAAHLSKIFEEYTTYSGGQDRSGGGLGLAICKMIMNRHGGNVWAESSPNGAMFSFVLPFHRLEPRLRAERSSLESAFYAEVV